MGSLTAWDVNMKDQSARTQFCQKKKQAIHGHIKKKKKEPRECEQGLSNKVNSVTLL